MMIHIGGFRAGWPPLDDPPTFDVDEVTDRRRDEKLPATLEALRRQQNRRKRAAERDRRRRGRPYDQEVDG